VGWANLDSRCFSAVERLIEWVLHHLATVVPAQAGGSDFCTIAASSRPSIYRHPREGGDPGTFVQVAVTSYLLVERSLLRCSSASALLVVESNSNSNFNFNRKGFRSCGASHFSLLVQRKVTAVSKLKCIT
jgi:hypothetical protein